jgi:hypothetical protein
MSRLFAVAVLMLSVPMAAQTPKRDAPEKTTDSRDKVICKRFAETGSLVGQKRICKPKAEWERDRDNLRQFGGASSCGSAGSGKPCGL